MGAGVASRAGVSAHDLLRSGEPRVGSGRVREEVEKEEETESKAGHVDFSSVRLNVQWAKERKTRNRCHDIKQQQKKIQSVPFPALSILNKHGCVCK